MKYFAILTPPEMLMKLASGKYTADLRKQYLGFAIEPVKVLLVSNKNRKVVGEYIFEGAERIRVDRYSSRVDNSGKGGYSLQEFEEYREGSAIYLWHFSKLFIYNRTYEATELVCERSGTPFGKRTEHAYVRLEQ